LKIGCHPNCIVTAFLPQQRVEPQIKSEILAAMKNRLRTSQADFELKLYRYRSNGRESFFNLFNAALTRNLPKG
jgi:hypothetical protein